MTTNLSKSTMRFYILPGCMQDWYQATGRISQHAYASIIRFTSIVPVYTIILPRSIASGQTQVNCSWLNPTSNQNTYMSHPLQTQTLPRCQNFAMIVWGIAPMWVQATNSFQRSNHILQSDLLHHTTPKDKTQRMRGASKLGVSKCK